MIRDDFVPAEEQEQTEEPKERGKYDMVEASDIEHFRGKKKIEVFVAHCLWRLRKIGRRQVILAEEQLEATLETNRLLRKLVGESEPSLTDKDKGILAKAKDVVDDLIDDGKRNHSNTTNKKDKKHGR